MASYRKEIRKWMGIFLDKYFLEAAYEPKTPGLSLAHAYLLYRFPEGLSLTDFTRFCRIKRSEALKALKELERRGFLERVEDEEDQRRRRIVLTASGRRMQEQLHRTLEEKIDFLLSGLSHNEEVAILKFISRINQLTVEKYKIDGGE